MSVKIPEWLEANDNFVKGNYTPLDLFVMNNEPAGKEAEEKFRHELQSLVDYISGLTKRAADVRKAGAKKVSSKSKVTVSPARG